MQTEKNRENQQKALKLKDEGNQFFKAKLFEKAIEKYTQAINICQKISILYSNRSRCYRNLKQYEKSYQDAQMAIKYDDKNIKAYFLMGQSLVTLAEHTKDVTKINIAIEKLKKSLTLCPSQGKSEFQQTFVHQIYRAKKKLWQLQSQSEKNRKKTLRSYLINMIQNDISLDEQKKDRFEINIKNLLQSNFDQQKHKIPEALICPISKMIMINPVCNQYGNSYAKKSYLDYLKKNGQVDFLTSKALKTPIMYNNINIKKAIQVFLQKNPWAYQEKNQ